MANVLSLIHKSTPMQTKLDVQKPTTGFLTLPGKLPPKRRESANEWPAWLDELAAPNKVWANPETGEVIPDLTDDATDAAIEAHAALMDKAVEAEMLDYREVTGTSAELQKLYNAQQRNQKVTGKGFVQRFSEVKRNAAGEEIAKTMCVYRIR